MNHDRIILLVEDNPDDELLTVRTLRRSNIANQIIVAHNGEEALQVLFAADAQGTSRVLPIVVLLDLKLPKIDGLNVLRQVRANPLTHVLPIVILTSSSEERDIIESYSLGANSYVRKPVDFDEFTEAVRQLGLYWILINQPLPTGCSV
jgi:two-component system response regulator